MTTPKKTTSKAAAAAPKDRVSLARLGADIDRARVLERKIAALQDELSPIVAKVKAVMGDAQTGTIGRAVVATWATTTRETLAAKDLKAEQPEIARKYTRTTTVRTFRWADPQ